MNITQCETPGTLMINLVPEKSDDDRVIERIKKEMPPFDGHEHKSMYRHVIHWELSADDIKTNGITLLFPK